MSCSPVDGDMSHLQRLARFFTRAPVPTVIDRFVRQLNSMLVQHKIPSSADGSTNRIIFSTVDRRKGLLTGEINIHVMSDDLTLVLFNKTKGDALEFKRFFKFVMYDLKDLVVQV